MNIFGGRSDFFAVREKKFDRPPCVIHRSVVDGGTPLGGDLASVIDRSLKEGGTPRGGVPPRGDPP